MSINHEKAAELQRMLLMPAFFGATAVFLFQTVVHDIALWARDRFDQSFDWTFAKYLFTSWIVAYVCTSFVAPNAKPGEYDRTQFILDTIESIAALVALAALGFADVFAGDVVYEHPKFAYGVALIAIGTIALHGYWRRPSGETSIHIKIARAFALALCAIGLFGIANADRAESVHTIAILVAILLWLVLSVYAYVRWTEDPAATAL